MLAQIAVYKLATDVRYHAGQTRRAADREQSIDAPSNEALADAADGPAGEAVVSDLLAGVAAEQRQVVELVLDGRAPAETGAAVGASRRTAYRILEEFRVALEAGRDRAD